MKYITPSRDIFFYDLTSHDEMYLVGCADIQSEVWHIHCYPSRGCWLEVMKMLVRSKYSSEDQKEAARNLLLLKREREQKRIKKELMQERRKAFARKRDALLLGLIERDGYKCVVCCEQDNLSIDHITPLSKGGMDELNNLQLLCRKCNSAKGDRSIGRAEADKEIE